MKSARAPLLATLLLASGSCALTFQVCWLRELRLVFGASTYASAAALAVFMGGLGAGSLVLGRRAERDARPLRLYGLLELGVAAGAGLSPLFLVLAREVYVWAGGSMVLGRGWGLALRLALTALVLGLPTFLMGGTLPAAARAATSGSSRRAVALLYGANTLGAVGGALVATFVLLEVAGTRRTILFAALLNAGVGALALWVARKLSPDTDAAAGPPPPDAGAATRTFVAVAAAATGFVFFLMELVWYRMLAPVLGGTTYTFGLILAMALFGVGAGGLALWLADGRLRASVALFSASCAVEALFVAAALALGDRLVLLLVALKPPGIPSLAALLPAWLTVCGVVVLPAAVVAGFQFPLLIGLLGAGRDQVGRQTGAVYAWNTAGAVAGAIAGGFGLLPALGALGCWRLAAALLALVGACGLALSLREGVRAGRLAAAAAVAVAAVALLWSEGPTAVWRHSQVGVRSVRPPGWKPNEVRNWLHELRFDTLAQWEGVESSVGLNRKDGLAFVVNGKIDGNVRSDAGTQVMAAMIGAALHPAPKRAMVIGLGTGSSAGWLGAVPGMERVDVAELEPAILEVARLCAPVNKGALDNPKVRVALGDGRELLMTSRERYDLIMSEPSNPYRAGVASLYTREFYRAVANRLAPGGIFSQWVQAYDVDAETIRVIRATLTSVFADVQAWRTCPGDLLFTCATKAPELSAPVLRERLASEPFGAALLAAWGVAGLEGFLGAYVGSDAFVRRGLAGVPVNTDDRTIAEFGFARGLAGGSFLMEAFRAAARDAGTGRPLVGGEVDWTRVEANRLLTLVWQNGLDRVGPPSAGAEAAYRGYLDGSWEEVRGPWREGTWTPREPLETLMLAEALANLGEGAAARPLIATVRGQWPAAAAGIEARLLLRERDAAGAARCAVDALRGFREDPWSPWQVMQSTVALARDLAVAVPAVAPQIFEALAEPFSGRILDSARIDALSVVARGLGPAFAARAVAQLEPHVFWRERFLRFRLDAYERTGSPLARAARRDLEEYLGAEESAAAAPPSPVRAPLPPSGP